MEKQWERAMPSSSYALFERHAASGAVAKEFDSHTREAMVKCVT
jgi:hypothetical protein